MKSYLIYALILFQLEFLTSKNNHTLLNNSLLLININYTEETILNFTRTENKTVYVNIIDLNKDANLKIKNSSIASKNITNSPKGLTQMEFKEGTEGFIIFTVDKNTWVEITSTMLYRDDNNKNDPYFYQKIEYNIDTQIDVMNNNFVIFLENENVSDKFDMKFKFNDNNNISGTTATLGFLYLPNDDIHYISLGKNYKKNGIGGLIEYKFTKNEDEFKVNNTYYKKQNTDTIKTKFAFIFSLYTNDRVVGGYSFSINSEIINIFLIVSIVIALVFAVITFFLIRRKQSSESTTIENTDGLLKDGDKGENEGKDENEGKKDEEKDEKEEKKENEEKDEKEDDNVEEEKKKIKAAEN